MRRGAAGLVVIVALAVVALTAQTPTHGTRVAGRVVDASNRPIAGALVLLAGTDITLARVTATDRDGRFLFEAVPSGHALVVAGRPAYLSALYGAARAGRPGRVVAVGTDKTADLTVRLQRGSVIAGRVLDRDGQPVPGVRIRVTPRRLIGRTVVLGGDVGEPPVATTDLTGAYRVYDLAPGDYLIATASRYLGPGDARIVDSPAPDAGPERPQGASVAYLPTYYPSATTSDEATVVTLSAGVDRLGLDIRTAVGRLGRIDGVMAGVEGSVPAHQIQIRPRGWTTAGAFLYSQTAQADVTGRFAFTNVPPGAYTVVARMLPPPPDPETGRPRPIPAVWAMADIRMTGGDGHVVLHWENVLTVTGRVTFAGLSEPPTDVTVRVGLRPTPASGGLPAPETVPIDATGQFTLKGVMPGEYWLSVQVPVDPATQLPDWIPAHAMIDGHDAFDDAFPVGMDLGTPDIPVLLTRETQQIDGTLLDSSGRPVADCPVVAFSTDHRFWFPQSRHIALRRTDRSGGFLFNLAAALPPGAYYVAAVPDLEPNEQFDPTLLSEVAAQAREVTVASGGSATVHLRLAHR